jgi:hypothetical protein
VSLNLLEVRSLKCTKSDTQIKENQNIVTPSIVDLNCRELSNQRNAAQEEINELFSIPPFTSESLLKFICEKIKANSASVGDRR